MTIQLLSARQRGYELSENLRGSSNPSALRGASLYEGDREELVLERLGVAAWGRLHHFRHYYSQGWGDGSGKPLSPRALEGFYRFVSIAKLSPVRPPSVFLTDDGSLELCWEDKDGRAIQVEFTSAGVEIFSEASGEERFLSFDRIGEIAAEH